MCWIRKVSAIAVCLLLLGGVLPRSLASMAGSLPRSIDADEQRASVSMSAVDFSLIALRISDLKNPTFRAFLRMRILSWMRPDRTETREAALAVATEALTDLCANQDDISRPTASWLFEGLARSIREIAPTSADEILARFSLKRNDKVPQPARDLAAAMKLLKDPSTRAAGIESAKKAIMTGQVSADNILSHLLVSQTANPDVFVELLIASIIVEEQKPGVIPLKLLPFFSAMFLKESNPIELRTRFVLHALQRTRLRPEELNDPIVRQEVVDVLKAMIQQTSVIAPALYPEMATRLNLLSPGTLNTTSERQAVQKRIKESSDPLEQTVSEAEATTDAAFKSELLDWAARQALTQKQLRRAVDLAVRAHKEEESQRYSLLDRFLGTVSETAIKEKQPDLSVYAISKMVKPLNKANGFQTLGDYYTKINDRSKSKSALAESLKQLQRAEEGKEKVKSAITLAESVLAVDPAAAYDAFQLVVASVNKLTAPEKDKESLYYASLMPVAEQIIKGFRLWAAQDDQRALVVAQEVKIPELRVSAMSGAYSKSADAAPQSKKN